MAASVSSEYSIDRRRLGVEAGLGELLRDPIGLARGDVEQRTGAAELVQVRLGRDDDHESTVRPEDARELAAVPRREDVEGHIDGAVADRQRPPEIEHHARRCGSARRLMRTASGDRSARRNVGSGECASDRRRVVAGSAPQVGDPRRAPDAPWATVAATLGDGLGDGGVGAAFEQRGTAASISRSSPIVRGARGGSSVR